MMSRPGQVSSEDPNLDDSHSFFRQYAAWSETLNRHAKGGARLTERFVARMGGIGFQEF
jgi:hypothetical protein